MNNVYEELGLKSVINASGKMTKLGVSIVDQSVLDESNRGAKAFVVIDDLIKRAGEIIATYADSEDALPTCSASAGIALSIAGLIAKDSKTAVERLPISSGLKNEVIIQKGHVINYGAPVTTMLRLAGATVIEAGMSNECKEKDVEELIGDNTVCLFYVKSHHTVQKGMLSIEKMIGIAHRNNLPLLIDAAAEEDLKKYIAIGADLVVYSGSKALEANTSGFVVGKREYIDYARRQYYGIGRAMKVGKEQIVGLLKALDNYNNKDNEKDIIRQKELVNYLINGLENLDCIKASMIQDEAGREIYRCRIKTNKALTQKILKEFKEGNPSIYTREYLASEGIIDFDVRSINKDEADVIIRKLGEIVNE